LATENLRQSLIAKMQTGRDDPAVLHGVLSGDRYVLQAPSIIEQGDALLLESNNNDPVRLELFINSRIDGQPTRIYEAQSATLEVRTNGLSPDPTIDLELNDVTVTGINQGPRGGDKSIPIRQLSWPTSILQQGDGQVRPNEFISMAELPMYADSDRVGQMVDRVQSEIADLGRRITGLRHERAASAVSCALLLVLGALLSLRLRGQMPLVVYFWSFLLAIITIIIVGSGQNVIGSLDMPVAIGVVLLWSGNGMLLTVILLLYLRIAKH
jgi:lipopolysaccharide export LptBFGC system permease protein LptF